MRTKLLILLILFATEFCFGQVQLELKKPAENQLREKDLWGITAMNKGQEEVDIYLEGNLVEAKEGEIVKGWSGYFKLKVNETKRITAVNVPGGSKVTWLNKKYESIILRTGSLGSAELTYCVTAKDKAGNELGRTCIQHSIANTYPATLVSPENGAMLSEGQLPTFNWFGSSPAQSGEKFTLTIVPVLGNQTSSEAMQKNTPWFKKENIGMTAFQYPLSARKLENGKYAWSVEVNGVRSETFTFNIAKEIKPKEKIIIDSAKKIELCGQMIGYGKRIREDAEFREGIERLEKLTREYKNKIDNNDNENFRTTLITSCYAKWLKKRELLFRL